MRFVFTPEQTNKIVSSPGLGQGYYDKLETALEACCSRWKLVDLKLIENFSMNCLFYCVSEIYGACVLRISAQDRYWLEWEAGYLQECAGPRVCRVYDADMEKGCLLLERIGCGMALADVPSPEKRLEVFASLFNGLHKHPSDPGKFRTYLSDVSGTADNFRKRPGQERVSFYLDTAEKFCREIQTADGRFMLLHGDLHAGNILLGADGGYKIIDPFGGYTGAPAFDTAKYFMDEYHDNQEGEIKHYLSDLIKKMSQLVNIPPDTIAKCFFIGMAMEESWNAVCNALIDFDGIEFAEELFLEVSR